MISFKTHTLSNGLTLIHHEDKTTQLCVTNILYNVGARDENPALTGFAHLFEHLMFGGSVNIPSFDTPILLAGGENNAFTSNDITNYHISVPHQNIETALWLESDRMLQLDFSEKKLAIQKGVVSEEFRQRYLNAPYGDVWLHLRPMAYKVHPYQWATIGKSIEHVENATLQQVKDFFNTYYNPSNASLCIAGNISFDNALQLTEKWFGDIPAGKKNKNQYPKEPPLLERIEKTVYGKVPHRAFYMAFPMVDIKHELYYAFDLLSDILSGSKSSHFTQILIKEKELFTQASAYTLQSIDEGLFIISGILTENTSFEQAENAILEIITNLVDTNLENDLKKVKNKTLTSNYFSQTSVLNIAMSLCYAHLLGNVNLINETQDIINNITSAQIKTICAEYLLNKKYVVLKYCPNE